MRYVNSMISTLKRNWKKLCLITVLFALCVTAGGYLKAKKDEESAAEQKEKIDTFLSQVEIYQAAIDDAKAGLALAEQQRDELQTFLDNSIYMHIDSDNAWVGSVSYTVKPGEGTNTGNVLNALNFYITKGSLREDIGDDYEELKVKYWSTVISSSIAGQTISITIMQPTEELAQKSIELIKSRLESYALVVAESHGSFELVEQETSSYKKSELDIINYQTARKGELKAFTDSCGNWETTIFNRQNTLDQYIENNKPDSLEVKSVSVKKTVAIFALIGLFLGVWIAIGIVLIDYIAGNRVKNGDSLKKLGLAILGTNSLKKGYTPDVAQTAAGISALLVNSGTLPLLNAPQTEGVVLYDLSKNEDTTKVSGEYVDALKEINCLTEYVDADDAGAGSLNTLLKHRSAVLVACAGDTRLDKTEEALAKFDRYGIKCLGAIVLE